LSPELCSSCLTFCILLSHVGVTYKTASGLHDWIYCIYTFTTRNYRQLALSLVYTLYSSLFTHALGFSVFTSRILATDLYLLIHCLAIDVQFMRVGSCRNVFTESLPSNGSIRHNIKLSYESQRKICRINILVCRIISASEIKVTNFKREHQVSAARMKYIVM
jgi:hypothetical protein